MEALLRDAKKIRQLAEDLDFNLRGEPAINNREVARHVAKLNQQARIIVTCLLFVKESLDPPTILF